MHPRVVLLASIGSLLAGCPASHRVDDAGADARPGLDAWALDAPPRMPRDAARDVARDSHDAPFRMCVASCTTDSQCAASCPVNPLGANCCDAVAGVCYAGMTAVCPMPYDVGPPRECPPSCASDADCVDGCGSMVGGWCCEHEVCVLVFDYLCPADCVETCATDADCAGSCPSATGAWCCGADGRCSHESSCG